MAMMNRPRTTIVFAALLGLGGWALIAAQSTRPSAAAAGEGQPMKKTPKYSKSGYDLSPLSKERRDEILKTLTPEQRRVTQDAGTEPAFCGNLVDNHQDGIYV